MKAKRTWYLASFPCKGTRSRPLFLRCKPPHQPSGLMVSVHGGTHDAAGIPGTFSGGIQAPAVYRLTVFPPQDPYWCRSPGLHPDHQPLGAESGELPFKIPQPVLQGFRHKVWQDLPQVCRDQSRSITGLEWNLQIWHLFFHKAPAGLGRCPIIPADAPGQPFILPLEFHPSQWPRSRLKGLMPFTTKPPCSEADATTCPPGHIQKEYTARPVSLS